MEDKSWYLSKTIWGSVIALLGIILPVVAQMGTEGVTDDVTKMAGGIAAIVGSAIALYGRYKATTSIKKKV